MLAEGMSETIIQPGITSLYLSSQKMMTEKTSLLQAFLEQEWPEWRDDDFARARFKAFTGQKQDWEERINFWRDAIVKVARHLDLLIIDTKEVQQKWFVRDGVVPMGLKLVLLEMQKSGELETVDQILENRPSTTLEKLSSLLRRTLGWAGFIGPSDEYMETEAQIEERLVVRSILQERAAYLIKSLAENNFSSVCIATLSKIKKLCGGAENAELTIGYLLLHNKAKYLAVNSDDHIEGFKLSLNGKDVSAVSENDRHFLQLQWTLELLQIRLNTLDLKVETTRTELIKVAKAGARHDALRRLRNMKLLQVSRDQCAGFMDKIEQVLGVIADAETSKKVTEAIQVGAAAIKENHVSLDDVHSCLDELDEAITVQREIEDTIGATHLSKLDEDDSLFEEELATLEKELQEQEITSLPEAPKAQEGVKVSSVKKSDSEFSEADQTLEKEFAKMALELA
ncbi:charged multivesicular body protein 7 [Marchantia polymorpha subsp. ruderalis]|uniref:Charged multivesicular body protein 7 n=2 Tax=Marchantia polymorpha TaxID=3197 RepID=A0AAF6BPG1_MARPO|nr:hypothetical protein MARPO_0053s0040 [Marchantia polymorpha]BBN13895.1 hypothetical protein Mp_6g07260 [Marchantia polymorpha subsp. ruderalis]|eukprot:PTQ38096.1 hypothetical protein MARPO_0053s0040 [Marchantia polymorpha]